MTELSREFELARALVRTELAEESVDSVKDRIQTLQTHIDVIRHLANQLDFTTRHNEIEEEAVRLYALLESEKTRLYQIKQNLTQHDEKEIDETVEKVEGWIEWIWKFLRNGFNWTLLVINIWINVRIFLTFLNFI